MKAKTVTRYALCATITTDTDGNQIRQYYQNSEGHLALYSNQRQAAGVALGLNDLLGTSFEVTKLQLISGK